MRKLITLGLIILTCSVFAQSENKTGKIAVGIIGGYGFGFTTGTISVDPIIVTKVEKKQQVLITLVLMRYIT
ncbi:MAG TPA: hypothetical protein PKW55_07650 [Spirochaetota bacterium]|nr:hypothetical protein [Spirochaetota bacterium]HOM38659.1 hypothetical protein [Spirochaetota bacterium]HPQ49825.1 hypothetical protein [Spirochaetota bacterium]